MTTVSPPGAPFPQAPFPQATGDAGYYGLPLLKQPVWRWEAPAYLFVGGLAGAAAIIGAVSPGETPDAHRGNTLARDAKWIAAAGGPISAILLTTELGRPERFLNMLRVFKVRSPMSMGSWILVTFSGAASAALLAELVARRSRQGVTVRLLRGGTAVASAAAGSLLSTYTGVLIGCTVVPAWNANARLLPVHFGAAGVGAASSLLELLGHRHHGLRRLALAAALVESLIGAQLERQDTRQLAPLKHGRSGTLTRVGGLLSGPVPLLLRLLAPKSRLARRAAGLSTLAGSLLTRLAWIAAGRRSAQDARQALAR
jgi:formate-dependent nitrite reductase membrane component NrfD